MRIEQVKRERGGLSLLPLLFPSINLICAVVLYIYWLMTITQDFKFWGPLFGTF
jgi:hypothetical protein